MKTDSLIRPVTIIATVLSFGLAGPMRTLAADAAAKSGFKPGEVLVKLKAGATAAEKADALKTVAGRVVERIHTEAMKADGAPPVLRVAVTLPVPEAVRILRAHPAVAIAEPNLILVHQATSNDPYYTDGRLWNMYGDATSPANPNGSQAGEAWATGAIGSPSVYVGVIDEGIQFTHPDLDANVWTNPFDPADGVDNDGNGFTDDLHGWDFAHRDNSIYDAGEDSHGTHVAGTIAAEGGNGVGVVGVDWRVRCISGKFLGGSGGNTADAIKAIDYFTDLKTRHGLNIVATNNSWGPLIPGPQTFSQVLLDAMVRGAKRDILFVAAAGNNGTDNDLVPQYPANYDTTAGAGYNAVISVAATDRNGAKASYSNFGRSSVHLAAPGDAIYSTLPVNTYGQLSGTSMAAPHVAGAAALYLATHPGSTALQIRTAILDAASATPATAPANQTTTGGRLNVSALVPSVPIVATEPAAAVTSHSATLNGALNPNGLPTSYQFEFGTTTAYGFTTPARDAGAGSSNTPVSAPLTGLSPGTTYHFRLRATNSAGNNAGANLTFTTAALVDVDGDGMPDDYEAANGFNAQNSADASQDRDGDGLSNLEEYRAGTSSGDPSDSLRITGIRKQSSAIEVSATSVPGKRYRLERSSNLAADEWPPVTNTTAGTGGILTFTDPAAANLSQHFYRVAVVP